MDNIHEDVVDMVANVGAKHYTTTSELLDAEDEGVSQAIVDGITKYNLERAPSYGQKVGRGLCTGHVCVVCSKLLPGALCHTDIEVSFA